MLHRDQLVVFLGNDPNDQVTLKELAAAAGLDADLVVLNTAEQLNHFLYRTELSEPFSFMRIPSLIVLDLHFSGNKGLAELERLKNHPFFKKIPTIIIADTADVAHIDKAYSLGCAGYFARPTSHEEWTLLLGLIRQYWFAVGFRPALESI